MPPIENINQILTKLIFYPQFGGESLVLKIVFLMMGLFFFGFIIFALVKTAWLKRIFVWDIIEFFTYRPYGKQRYLKKWKKIEAMLSKGLESEIKLAVLEADTILENTLKEMGFEGENLSARLNKVTPDFLIDLEQVKFAHEVRNNIVSDPNYRLEISDAKNILAIYEKALKYLEVI